MAGARVKGLAFRSVMQEFTATEGDATTRRALDLMPRELADRVGSEGGIMAATWYPQEDYVALWDALVAASGNRRDLPRVIGRRCVLADLNVVHKLVLRALSVPTVISLATRVFKSYYDTGSSRADALGDRQVRVYFEGCHGYSTPMWTELRGAVEMFGEQASGSTATSVWEVGGSARESDSTLLVTWR